MLPAKPFFGDEAIFLSLAADIRDEFHYETRPFRPPMYPATIALLTVPDRAISIRLVRTFQAVAGGIATLLLYLLGRELFGHRVGILGAAAYAIYPLAVTTSVFLYPQAVLPALIYAALLAAILSRRRSSGWWALAAGLLIGVAMLHVPNSVALTAATVIWLMLARSPERALRIRLAALVVIGTCATVLPWTVRNYAVTGGEIIPVSTNGPVNFWLGNNAQATLDTKSHLEPTGELARRIEGLPMEARDDLLLQDAIGWISANPAQFVRFTALKFVAFFRPTEGKLTEGIGDQRLARLGILLTSAPVILLALVGVFPAIRRESDTWLLVGSVLFSAALYCLFFVNLRFRAPLDGLLIVVGANCVVNSALWRVCLRRNG